MKNITFKNRALAIFVLFVPLLALFAYVALRSGPLAPVSVVLVPVERQEIAPTIFGIGTVGDWFCHVVDPTFWALDLDAPSTIRAEVKTYLDANPQVKGELTAIRQPLVDIKNRCGAAGDPALPAN